MNLTQWIAHALPGFKPRARVSAPTVLKTSIKPATEPATAIKTPPASDDNSPPGYKVRWHH